MNAWYVIQTKPQKEQVVLSQLKQAGYETLFPILKNCFSTSALFPSYLFVRLTAGSAADYRLVQYTRGVVRLLGTQSNGPTAVPENVMTLLRQRTDSQGVIVQKLFKKAGEMVLVQRGLLKDFVGILEKPADTTGRLQVLFKLFNQPLRAVLTMRDVAPLAC